MVGRQRRSAAGGPSGGVMRSGLSATTTPEGNVMRSGFPAMTTPEGSVRRMGFSALEEDALAEFPALEPQPAQLTSVFDVPFRGVKVAGRLVVVFVVGLEPGCPLAILFSRHDSGEPGDPDEDSVAFRGHIGTPSCRLTITPSIDAGADHTLEQIERVVRPCPKAETLGLKSVACTERSSSEVPAPRFLLIRSNVSLRASHSKGISPPSRA